MTCFLLTSCDKKIPILSFKSTTVNFGQVQQNNKVSIKFEVYNKGNANLKILDVLSSCGCSKPKWPKIDIKPGEKQFISVVYDPSISKDMGHQKKAFEVLTNGNPALKLIYIEGNVIL